MSTFVYVLIFFTAMFLIALIIEDDGQPPVL
jgi:hypothetical protein